MRSCKHVNNEQRKVSLILVGSSKSSLFAIACSVLLRLTQQKLVRWDPKPGTRSGQTIRIWLGGSVAPRPSSPLSPIGGHGCGEHPLTRVYNLYCKEQLHTVHRDVLLGLHELLARTPLKARWIHDVFLQLGLQHCQRNHAGVIGAPDTPPITLTASPGASRRLGGMCAPPSSEPPQHGQT